MSYMVGQKNERTNNRTMIPTLENNAASGYQGPVKIELLKGAGLLSNGSNLCAVGKNLAANQLKINSALSASLCYELMIINNLISITQILPKMSYNSPNFVLVIGHIHFSNLLSLLRPIHTDPFRF